MELLNGVVAGRGRSKACFEEEILLGHPPEDRKPMENPARVARYAPVTCMTNTINLAESKIETAHKVSVAMTLYVTRKGAFNKYVVNV
jgi:hypothetical protein